LCLCAVLHRSVSAVLLQLIANETERVQVKNKNKQKYIFSLLLIRKRRRFVETCLESCPSLPAENNCLSLHSPFSILLSFLVQPGDNRKCILNWNNEDLITKEIPFDIFSAKCHTIREMQFETCRFCTTCKLRLIMQLKFLQNVYDFFLARL
jgi:hypothetical protein